MKLAPSRENVELLREVAAALDQTAEEALGAAGTFRSKVASAASGLTEGDEESLMDIAQSAGSQLRSLYDTMKELAKETSDLADELEEAILEKTLKR